MGGLIMGIWNSHTSFGNIIGSLIAAEYADTDWALSFVIPGAMIFFMVIVVYLTIVPHPEMLGYDDDANATLRLLDDTEFDENDSEDLNESRNESQNELQYEPINQSETLNSDLENDPENYIENHSNPGILEETRSTIVIDTSRNNAISFFEALCIPGV